jgi:hypothetical protein
MTPARQLPAEGDGGEGVARVAECREEIAAPRRPERQTSSASSRIIALRASGSTATGVVMRVPTPASR